MKKIQYLFTTLVLGLALTSCGDSLLTQYPEGEVMLEEQFNRLTDMEKLSGSVYGIYSRLYQYGSHSIFGERSIDMYGDMQCGDMAMAISGYGWFEDFERGWFYSDVLAGTPSYLWSYYYDIINLANRGLLVAEKYEKDIQNLRASGTITKDDEELATMGYYYAQLLAIRGWAYDNLLTYFCNPMDQLASTMDVELAVPIYTVTELKAGTEGEALATIEEVYDRIYEDLFDAIDYMDFFEQKIERGSKLEINADVARIMLAYSMLNQGTERGKVYNGQDAYEVAYDLATDVISGGKFPLLKQADLTETGFADINAANWMWGEEVTEENSTGLASFFGQVDIHSYGYASAGATKGIDSKLYNAIPAWDARINWFRAPTMTYSYAPDGKFYCPKTRHTVKNSEIDRNWLDDNVFMRVEVAYLIAAEAAYKGGSAGGETDAKTYLDLLCQERIIPGQETAYGTWLSGLSGTSLKEALIYNWRVEMWGEGYGLQTLRRLTKSVSLGTNHISRASAEINILSDYAHYQCAIPSSETSYNPELVKSLNELTTK